MVKPDPGNVQSMVIARYPHRLRVILLFRIDEPSKAQAFLQKWAGKVDGGLEPGAGTEPVFHFAFNWPGVALLIGANASASGTLDTASGAKEMEGFFTNPKEAPHRLSTAVDLGLIGSSAPENWWAPGVDPDGFHIAMFCCFSDEAQKSAMLKAIRSDADKAGLYEWLFPSFDDKALSGAIPHDGVLHFGFRDGISRVELDWEGTGAAGKVDIRELLLGYSNDTYATMPVNSGPWNDFVRDGCYIAIAWLHQDVAAFNRFLAENSSTVAPHAGDNDPEEWLAAKMMGRWRDGSPLAKHPLRKPGTADLSNDFRYAKDELGENTPLYSHIRVCNPRDQELSPPNRLRFKNGPPQLVRRGFSYGPTLSDADDDGKDRGLVGVFACARINEQLYTVIRWMQETGFSDQFRNVKRGWLRQDNMFGLRSKPKAVPSANIRVSGGEALELPLRDFIHYRGLSLFFTPSLNSLRVLIGA